MSQAYLSDEDYNFIYSRSPRVCVDLLIRNSEGEILLTKRDIEPYKDHWHLPGGRIKFRETVNEAIKRIAKSELGIELPEGVIIGYCEYLEEVQGGNPRHSISLIHNFEYNGESPKDGIFFKNLPDIIIPEQKKWLGI